MRNQEVWLQTLLPCPLLVTSSRETSPAPGPALRGLLSVCAVITHCIFSTLPATSAVRSDVSDNKSKSNLWVSSSGTDDVTTVIHQDTPENGAFPLRVLSTFYFIQCLLWEVGGDYYPYFIGKETRTRNVKNCAQAHTAIGLPTPSVSWAYTEKQIVGLLSSGPLHAVTRRRDPCMTHVRTVTSGMGAGHKSGLRAEGKPLW